MPRANRPRRFIIVLGISAAVVAVVGPFRLKWHDDIRDLDIPARDLRANDEAVRAFFGDSTERAIYFTLGETPAAARDALDRFLAWHDQQFPTAPATSAGLILPAEKDWLAFPKTLESLANFDADLRTSLEKHSYTAESFAPFFDAWKTVRAQTSRPSYDTLIDDFRHQLTGPLGLLFKLGGRENWFLSTASHARTQSPPPETASIEARQLESLNTLWSRYRVSAARLSGLGLAVIGASVFVLYGFKRGIRIFMIPAGSCFFALGLLGLCGQTLTIFHLLGAFLGVCLSHNYAIFSAENAGRSEPPPPSIRLSALTTASSFGVLALSKIPVISGLGVTVALIVMTALIMVELEPLTREEASS